MKGWKDPLWWISLIFILFLIAIGVQAIRNGVSRIDW